MQAISAKLEYLLAAFLVVLMATMVIDVTWQVITRFILNDPSSYTEEVARFLLMWIGLLGAAYAYRKHSHLSLDLLMQNASVERQLWLIRIAQMASFLFAASAMVYGGIQLMILTLSPEQTTAATKMTMGYIYSCIPLSGLLICWFALDTFLHPEQALVDHHTDSDVV